MRKTSHDYEHLCRLILVGDAGVGKTSLCTRFVDDQFSDRRDETQGKPVVAKSPEVMNIKTKTLHIKSQKVKMNIIDTAG